MKFKKILIFGSTYLSAVTCDYLIKNSSYELVGYVPNTKRLTIPGKMSLPAVSKDTSCDLILSIQYDQKICDLKKTFNVHTGLLPEYGGVDILYHTFKNSAKEQGLTFHKITDKIDFGPIISKITYPVFRNDNIMDLYNRILLICPFFVLSSLKLLEKISVKNIDRCYKTKPIIYRTGQIGKKDIEQYKKTGEKLKKIFL